MKIAVRSFFLILFCFINTLLIGQSIRSIEGSHNNSQNTEWGAEGDELYLITTPAFEDGVSEMTGQDRPNPRHISNYLFSQEETISDDQNLSDFIWVFGQFLDHDIVLVDNDLTEPLAIRIPEDDPVFSQNGAPIGMFRSRGMLGTGSDENNIRRYANEVTAYLDASVIYGSTSTRADWLRSFVDGKLKMSSGGLLPWNTTTGEFNDPRDLSAPFMEDAVRVSSKHFVAGDVRANENPLLTSFHTLFVREHNRLCDEIKINEPDLDDEAIYQKARKIVGGLLQVITYDEWLPVMGVKLPSYNGYRPEVNAQVSNVFSSAAFRMGHTLINSNIPRLSDDGQEIPRGSITLREAFFNPIEINLAGGIEPYLRGMASQVQQKLDCKVIDDVRNFLFGNPSQGGLDLAAININRGRERGLGDFNSIRADVGLPRLKSFSEISDDDEAMLLLSQMYSSIDDIDPWVGMLAEDYMPGAMFGSTIMAIMEDQFTRLRDGDKFFFEADSNLSETEKAMIRQTTLRDVIMRNTDIKIMQENVFVAVDRDEIAVGPDLENIDMNAVAYPNPTEGPFNVKIFAQDDYDVDIIVYDNFGQLVSQRKASLVSGNNTLAFDFDDQYSSKLYNIIIRRDVTYKVLRVLRP